MLMSSAGAKLGLTGITPPTQQKPAGTNPAYEEGVKKIAKERLDTVKYLRETEARIRTVQDVLKEVGTESAFGKQQKAQLDQLLSDQQTYNKKIKFLDTRLKDPKLVSTYIETKQPVPQELKPSFGQEVLLGEKDWQRALISGQNKYNKMANNALDAIGFKYVPEGIIKDITKGVLNPLSYTQTVADVFGNPTKFMDDTFYTMANPNASAEERALGGLNFVLFVASVVPGAAALKKGGVKQLLDEAVEKAVAAGVKVESAVNKVKKALDPTTYKNILEKAKVAGAKAVKNVGEGVKLATDAAKSVLSTTAPPIPASRRRQAGQVGIGLGDLLKFGKFTDTEVKQFNEIVGNKANKIVPLDGLLQISTPGNASQKGFAPNFRDQFTNLLTSVVDDVKKGKKVLDPTYVKTFINDLDALGIDITKVNPLTKLADIQNAVNNGEVFIKQGYPFYFPKGLQDDISKALEAKAPGFWQKIFKSTFAIPAGATTEKRFVQKTFPELLPSVKDVTQYFGKVNEAIEEAAPDLLDTMKAVQKEYKKDPAYLTSIKDVLTGAKGKTAILSDLDNIAKGLQLDDPRLPFIDNLKLFIGETPGVGSGKFKDDETVLSFLLRTSEEMSDKVFSAKRYRDIFEKAENKVKGSGLAAVEKVFDPMAGLTLMIGKAKRIGVAEEVGKREIISDFLQTTLDAIPDANRTQKDTVRVLKKVFDDVNSQLKASAPGIDDAIADTFTTPIMSAFLQKGAMLTGKSQIAGNIGTLFAQLPPLMFNAVSNGLFQSAIATMRAAGNALPGAINRDAYKAIQLSNFLRTRFGSEATRKLENIARDNFIKSQNPGIRKFYDTLKAKFGEGFVDTVTRNTITMVDKFVTNTVYLTNYQKGIAAGMTPEQAARAADFVTEKLISGRGPGEMPPWFNAGIFKSVLQYGLEALNQPSIINDLSKSAAGVEYKNKLEKYARLAAKGTAYTIGAYALNNVIEKISGRRPALDPAGLYEDYIKGTDKNVELTPDFYQEGAPGMFAKTTEKLPGILKREPSKSYVSEPLTALQKGVETLTGLGKVDIRELPTFRIAKDAYQWYKINKEEGRLNADEVGKQFAITLGASFIKGGGQAKKVLYGTYALMAGYDNEKNIPEKDKRLLNQFLTNVEKREAVIDAQNKLERNTKTVYVDESLIRDIWATFNKAMDWKNTPSGQSPLTSIGRTAQALAFGPAGTKAAREVGISRENYDAKIKFYDKMEKEALSDADAAYAREMAKQAREERKQTYGAGE